MLLHLPPMQGHASGQRVKNGPALAGAVRDAITRTITTLPEQLRQSLTWDQGAEMALHAHLRIDTGADSSGRRNIPCMNGPEELVQSLGRCFSSQGSCGVWR